MKKSLFFLLSLGFGIALQAQEVPRFQKVQVASTGCNVYMPGDVEGFEVSESEDGSLVHTAEVQHGDYFFAAIVVEFKEDLSGDTEEDRVNMLTGYMDFLQQQFGITGAAGYGKGHTLESHPSASGVIDYWEDAEGTQYAVKGWIDENHLAVLLLYGPGEYPYFNAQEMFLNGFRFPEE